MIGWRSRVLGSKQRQATQDVTNGEPSRRTRKQPPPSVSPSLCTVSPRTIQSLHPVRRRCNARRPLCHCRSFRPATPLPFGWLPLHLLPSPASRAPTSQQQRQRATLHHRTPPQTTVPPSKAGNAHVLARLISNLTCWSPGAPALLL
ncbi:hypothetical protein IQ07DRAFT_10075 [Pyrenochaeta sp. DS3sAY3a]|nr:hypothetical protein IQ07DRAFT_10075 [Pyrenochaeta sp. DS3sAY3a]